MVIRFVLEPGFGCSLRVTATGSRSCSSECKLSV